MPTAVKFVFDVAVFLVVIAVVIAAIATLSAGYEVLYGRNPSELAFLAASRRMRSLRA